MRFALIFGEAANGLRRNLSMVVSVILVTFISLTFVGAAILMQMQITQMKGYWYDRAQVAVYLCTSSDQASATCAGNAEATPDQVAAVDAQLKSPTLAPFVKKSYFQDHKQVFAQFQKDLKNNPVASTVTPDMLNETYWISLKDPSRSDVIVEALGNLPGVQSVVDQRAYLQPIFNMLNVASFAAIGIAVLMLVAAALLISTTIRLSAFSRRRELGIMRLVGASNRFIQTPFVLEGIFASVVGALLASAAVVGIVHFFVRGYLQSKVASINFVGVGDTLIVVPILIVAGIAVAGVASNIAISRYLKV